MIPSMFLPGLFLDFIPDFFGFFSWASFRNFTRIPLLIVCGVLLLIFLWFTLEIPPKICSVIFFSRILREIHLQISPGIPSVTSSLISSRIPFGISFRAISDILTDIHTKYSFKVSFGNSSWMF